MSTDTGKYKGLDWREAFELNYIASLDTCWLWTGLSATPGYGLIVLNRERKYAHRLSWELHHGPIPTGLFVCHKCDVRLCVNPSHLFLGKPKDNTQDCIRKGRFIFGDKNGSRTKPGRLPRGESHPHAKVDRDSVRLMRSRYALGESQGKLASEYGLCQQSVHEIVARKTWKHVS